MQLISAVWIMGFLVHWRNLHVLEKKAIRRHLISLLGYLTLFTMWPFQNLIFTFFFLIFCYALRGYWEICWRRGWQEPAITSWGLPGDLRRCIFLTVFFLEMFNSRSLWTLGYWACPEDIPFKRFFKKAHKNQALSHCFGVLLFPKIF